ncbi:MAG: DJ-1/PfpI family protein [Anaerolineae bacterium]|nr:DJ-1/PfpI family protein [Anaerolineae bacterium]
MPRAEDYVFVLWADEFEETAATIFVTELRRAGLRVKVVGLTQRRSNGIYGLALVPDLTLDETLPLALNAICVVIPCKSPRVKQLRNDPRLREFFYQAHSKRARFVIGQLNEPDIANLRLFPVSTDNVIVYPEEGLAEFVRKLAASLTTSVQ